MKTAQKYNKKSLFFQKTVIFTSIIHVDNIEYNQYNKNRIYSMGGVMHKAISVQTKKNYKIIVSFDDGKVVLFDMQPLFQLIPAYRVLLENEQLYHSARIDENGEGR